MKLSPVALAHSLGAFLVTLIVTAQLTTGGKITRDSLIVAALPSVIAGLVHVLGFAPDSPQAQAVTADLNQLAGALVDHFTKNPGDALALVSKVTPALPALLAAAPAPGPLTPPPLSPVPPTSPVPSPNLPNTGDPALRL